MTFPSPNNVNQCKFPRLQETTDISDKIARSPNDFYPKFTAEKKVELLNCRLQMWSLLGLAASEDLSPSSNPDAGLPWAMHPFGRSLLKSL